MSRDRESGPPLADITTLGVGGPAPSQCTVASADELAEAVGAADRAGGALVLGGGSNVVIADGGVAIPVVRVGIPGVRVDPMTDGAGAGGDSGEAIATIGAGVTWDDAVAELVADGWAGVETLSGIPGSAGATPVQNVGAYGTEISDRLVDVELYDRRTGALRAAHPDELRLGYRSSALRGTGWGVVTSVRLRLTRSPQPVAYAQVADLLGVGLGECVPPAEVRAAVLELRRAKGMVLDPADPDTRSVGSFFTNPIVGPAQWADVLAAVAAWLGPEARVPHYPVGKATLDSHGSDATRGNAGPSGISRRFADLQPGSGRTKLSAAWLIERAGFPRGYPLVAGRGHPARPDAPAAISTKHTLALTNRGGATAEHILALAREVRDGVRDAFGVELRPEPMLIGLSLD